MGWSFSIGSISGIRIRIHLTFVLFLIWLGVAFWNQGGMAAVSSGLAYILLLFLCVVLHEFGHILTARRFGSQTLDVILLPIGGVARMKSIPEKPGQELAVALAGPCVNLVIAAVLISLIGWQTVMQVVAQPAKETHILSQLAVANVVLAVFNLLPAFPMDGGRALRALLSYRLGRAAATRLAMRIGHALAFGFGVIGFISGYPLLMLVALFVYLGATAENRDTQLHQLARRLKVSDAMITQFSTLPVTSRIADAVAVLIHSTQHDIPVIDGVGKMIGLLTRNQILRALHDRHGDVPVADVMRTDVPTISDRIELDEALRLMSEEDVPAIAVADQGGHLIGMVTLENLGQIMMLELLPPAG
jgi:Zn-dependent protease/CBS domain-containing protein